MDNCTPKACSKPGLNQLVFFWYMKALETSNEEVVFLIIEVDISSFSKNPYSKNSKIIWIFNYLDKFRIF